MPAIDQATARKASDESKTPWPVFGTAGRNDRRTRPAGAAVAATRKPDGHGRRCSASPRPARGPRCASVFGAVPIGLRGRASSDRPATFDRLGRSATPSPIQLWTLADRAAAMAWLAAHPEAAAHRARQSTRRYSRRPRPSTTIGGPAHEAKQTPAHFAGNRRRRMGEAASEGPR